MNAVPATPAPATRPAAVRAALISVQVLFLTTLVVGAVATTGIPVELFPSGFSDPFLMVVAPWVQLFESSS